MAATSAANQRAVLAAEQATEFRKQHAIVEVEIQSLLPTQQSQPSAANTPNNTAPNK